MLRREEIAARLTLDADLAVAVLTSFIVDTVAGAQARGVVLGLSGGIDSALAAALAVRALGGARVHAYYLPYRLSSPDSRRDAEAVARHLDLPLTSWEITAQIDAYFDAVDPEADSVRRGNKLARERMAILFDQAKKRDCLVLGTSNKTETLLGYSTVFGDHASSLNPLGDLWKRQVWQLSRHLGLPAAVIEKPPSADLRPGQTDEAELGVDYPTADEVLYLLFDQGLRPAEVVAYGYPAAAVERILALERASRFKRRLMLIARLSGSAINLDLELPRD
ncbi:MAG TPA: NAD+ synthase [Thermoanaerobaculia bacterium]|nr:NAD+ synthase [Thermoanaerobaculia bacterium]